MSHLPNTDALANQEPGGGSGEFQPSRPADEPMTTKGHAPGVLVGNDKLPEHNVEVLPAGSAPASKTFKPQNDLEVPPTGMQPGDELNEATAPTVGGTTSADVHTGLGHPGSGQTSKEIHHDGEQGRKNPGASLEGVGAATREFKTVDESDPKMKQHRALDSDEAEVGRGTVGGPAAEERVPVSADTVAAEANKKERMDRGT